ncbi:MAG: helix-turn-helix domain-containing protein [Holosporaceae bacterium]|nr:helix-turn-helix domain-containing protein [Holosporaceae bacterium]
MASYFVQKTIAPRNDLDSYIGSRVKSRRTLLGISQEKLGNYLGITFQQIQKYEKGTNRISASTLYNIANILSVDISYFMEGYKDVPSLNEDGAPVYEMDLTKKKETTELLRSYSKITAPVVRKKISELVRSISSLQK